MNLAFYGCSKIGRKIVEALKNDERFVLFGCASRDYSRCLEYKNELGFQKAYESYEDLLKDDNVDLVYVSTYISNHFNDVKACLEAKKNVIVEKSFTVNSKGCFPGSTSITGCSVFVVEIHNVLLLALYEPSKFIFILLPVILFCGIVI